MQTETDPDIDWVAALSHRDVRTAARAVGEAAEERRLFRHLSAEHDREGRSSYIEIDAPLELFALVRILRPAHVVEVGVSSGVSSAYLLQALMRNDSGTLHSVDLPKVDRRTPSTGSRRGPSWSLPSGRASGWAVPFALRRRWDLRLGDKADVLPLLAAELPRVEMLVYDVPHDDRVAAREFRLLDPLLPPGAVLIADHGPGGGLCHALAGRARAWGSHPVRRQRLGLYGARRRDVRAPAGPRGRRR
jgi:hypothetical protein